MDLHSPLFRTVLGLPFTLPLAPLLFLTGPASPTDEIDPATREAVVEATLETLAKLYVFPEKAAEMREALGARLAAGGYDELGGGEAFARAVTDDLRAISHDRHLGLYYSAEPLPEDPGTPRGLTPEEELRRARVMNFGFRRAEWLSGNVGYLDFRAFMDPALAAETAAASMSFLAHTDALIVDMRHNGGGHPAMVAFLSTYLFGDEVVHLNDLYDRAEDTTHQWWTLPHVPGLRFGPDKPVWVLTSDYTFSAAEEFTYNLQCLGRAQVVGETTGGGAHPTTFRRLHEHFGLGVPVARAINPITGTNWEGTGVAPDLECPADEALDRAHREAVRRLQGTVEEPQLVEQLKEIEARLDAKLD